MRLADRKRLIALRGQEMAIRYCASGPIASAKLLEERVAKTRVDLVMELRGQ